jgi:hypothetical protein
MVQKLLLWVMAMLLFPLSGFGAHFENLINLTIKIEDASYSHKIKTLEFNEEEITLDVSDMFKPRKILQQKLPPGRYLLNWSTEKTPVKWSEEATKTFEKIIVLEHGDGVVRVNVKGDAISMY